MQTLYTISNLDNDSEALRGKLQPQKILDNHFKQTMMFICSAERKGGDLSEKVWEGFMTRVVFTEIDHNYVNPVSDQYAETIHKIFSDRAFWVKEELTQGYNSPYSVFNEYMTWAVFSIYALEHYDAETFDIVNARVEKQMVEWRGFIKFKEFNRQLLELYRKRPAGQKVYELYPAILEWSGQFKG